MAKKQEKPVVSTQQSTSSLDEVRQKYFNQCALTADLEMKMSVFPDEITKSRTLAKTLYFEMRDLEIAK